MVKKLQNIKTGKKCYAYIPEECESKQEIVEHLPWLLKQRYYEDIFVTDKMSIMWFHPQERIFKKLEPCEWLLFDNEGIIGIEKHKYREIIEV